MNDAQGMESTRAWRPQSTRSRRRRDGVMAGRREEGDDGRGVGVWCPDTTLRWAKIWRVVRQTAGAARRESQAGNASWSPLTPSWADASGQARRREPTQARRPPGRSHRAAPRRPPPATGAHVGPPAGLSDMCAAIVTSQTREDGNPRLAVRALGTPHPRCDLGSEDPGPRIWPTQTGSRALLLALVLEDGLQRWGVMLQPPPKPSDSAVT